MPHIRVIDLYGFLERNLEQMAPVLTQTIGIRFGKHSSEFWGDYYSARRTDQLERFHLKENYNRLEGELSEPEYGQYPLILEVTTESPERAQEVEGLILSALGPGARLLRRKKHLKD